MMKVDFHMHADTSDVSVVRVFVKECERLEVRACLMAFGDRCDHPSCSNDQTLAITREFKDILIPVAFMDLWDHVDAGCIDHYRDQGFRALKCITPYYEYDHDMYMPLYEKAQQLHLPILFHTGSLRGSSGDAIYRRPMVKNMHPLTLDRVARSFPDLKIVLAHLGTSLFRHEAAEIVKLHRNVYFDLAGEGNFRAVGASELANLIRWSHYQIDPTFRYFDKMIYGSDAYLSTPSLPDIALQSYEYLIERIGLPAEIREKILGSTIADWLSIQ